MHIDGETKRQLKTPIQMVKCCFFVCVCVLFFFFLLYVSEATNVFKNLKGEMTSSKSKVLNGSKRKKEAVCHQEEKMRRAG